MAQNEERPEEKRKEQIHVGRERTDEVAGTGLKNRQEGERRKTIERWEKMGDKGRNREQE